MIKLTTMTDNSRKTATKVLLVNWSRFSNVCISLGGSTLFTGVNGSGKSTILDAMTYMLTGNRQFNKAAEDRDRNVISYVRGDTRSEGKNRFIRDGEVVSYIAMEFWAPVERQYLVVGVCIEYVNETSNTNKWFVFKDTKLDDCKFYTVEGKTVTVFPQRELMIKGKRAVSKDFMPRDKGIDQILRVLGLRCGADRYRAKLVKMLAFKPENNIDKFIQESVLDPHPIRAMDDIRDHRKKYNDAREIYEELEKGKHQLEVVQEKIAAYEGAERKYEVRRILLLYQDIKALQENQVLLEQRINANRTKQLRLNEELDRLGKREKQAYDRKLKADSNDLLRDTRDIIKGIKDEIETLERENKSYNTHLTELTALEKGIVKILDILQIANEFSQRDIQVLSNISSVTYDLDEKINTFIRLKNMVLHREEELQADYVRNCDRIREIDSETEELESRIKGLESDVLPFDKRYLEAKKLIKGELAAMNIHTDVRLFAELVKEIDPNWQKAIETFLGRKRFDIIVEGKYCQQAIEILHKHKLAGIKVIITDMLPDEEIRKDSAAEKLEIPNQYARMYANFLLNGIHLCDNLDELHQHPKGGLMQDGTLAKSYGVVCMSMEKARFYMGKDAIKQQLKLARKEAAELKENRGILTERANDLQRSISAAKAVNWDEDRYIFDVQLRIENNKKTIGEKSVELNEIEKSPGFAAALREKENADNEYNGVRSQIREVERNITLCKKEIDDDTVAYKESNDQISIAQNAYNAEIITRLELRKEVTELYERLHSKGGGPRVITVKTVENTRGERDAAVRTMEEEQRRYWRIMGQSDERCGIGYIPLFRDEYRDISNVRIEEAKQKLQEQQRTLENAFMTDFVAEIDEAIRDARKEINEINDELKNISFGKDRYQFEMKEKQDRTVFFNLCKSLNKYMGSVEAYRSLSGNDEEMEYNIRQFMDTILEEENEEEYTDYRRYFKYDMKIRSKQDNDETVAELSKKQGSASNGEKQTPYFIILAASLLQCYPRNVSCARLAFIDEAFSALSRERIEQMVKFFEDNKFQVIYAAPPEKIDSIGSYINSTVSLCMKGRYTWAVEGLVRADEFKA